MKCISVQLPWPWLIIRPDLIGDLREQFPPGDPDMYKDFENRDWRSNFRGDCLIHAGKKMDLEAWDFIEDRFEITLPTRKEMEQYCGHVMGIVEIYDWQARGLSNWAFGSGFCLRNQRILKPFPVRGQLQFFDVSVPDGIL